MKKLFTAPFLWLVMMLHRKPFLIGGVAVVIYFLADSLATGAYATLWILTRPFGTSPAKLAQLVQPLEKPVVKWGAALLAFVIRRPGIGWIIVAWNLREALLPPPPSKKA